MPHPDAAALLDTDRSSTLVRIAALSSELGELAAATVDSNVDDEHDPEGATIGFERAQLAAMLDQARAHLIEVEAAQQRLAEGSYGRCQRCQQPIGSERLAALPAARFCISCASRRAGNVPGR